MAHNILHGWGLVLGLLQGLSNSVPYAQYASTSV